jgi:plasmid maintenance system killer protein
MILSDNHSSLKVHKLNGPLKGSYSFSVNYKIRIIFQYVSKKEVVLLTVGDHKIYK